MKTEGQVPTTTSQTLLELRDFLAVDHRRIIEQAIDAIELESLIADNLYAALNDLLQLLHDAKIYFPEIHSRCVAACANYELTRTYIT